MSRGKLFSEVYSELMEKVESHNKYPDFNESNS